MAKNNLLIVWSNGDIEVANKFPLLYSSVILEREYWKKAHLMLWGPSILLAKKIKRFNNSYWKFKQQELR